MCHCKVPVSKQASRDTAHCQRLRCQLATFMTLAGAAYRKAQPEPGHGRRMMKVGTQRECQLQELCNHLKDSAPCGQPNLFAQDINMQTWALVQG